jgi:PPOX class probable FMN-dependent enzyme
MEMGEKASGEHIVTSEAGLRELYQYPPEMILKMKTTYLHEFHLQHLAKATFVCLGTVGDEGLDVSPRGGEPGFIQVVDNNCVGLPDWPGNNKIESMTNLVRDSRIGMLFIFPGLEYFMRLNGKATISHDPELCEKFSRGGKVPKTVIVVKIDQAYFHCGKAVNRAKFWEPSSHISRGSLPSMGTMMVELAKVTDHTPKDIDAAYSRVVKEDLYERPDQMRLKP